MTSSFLCLIACALRHALTQFQETGERKRIPDFNESSQLGTFSIHLIGLMLIGVAHWNRFARYWTDHDVSRAVSWMGYIQNQVNKMLEPRDSEWDTVRQEPYILNEDIKQNFDEIEIQPIRAQERLHMVRPCDIPVTTIQVQRLGLPT